MVTNNVVKTLASPDYLRVSGGFLVILHRDDGIGFIVILPRSADPSSFIESVGVPKSTIIELDPSKDLSIGIHGRVGSPSPREMGIMASASLDANGPESFAVYKFDQESTQIFLKKDDVVRELEGLSGATVRDDIEFSASPTGVKAFSRSTSVSDAVSTLKQNSSLGKQSLSLAVMIASVYGGAYALNHIVERSAEDDQEPAEGIIDNAITSEDDEEDVDRRSPRRRSGRPLSNIITT